MAHTLDPIFDTTVFSKTHLAYQKTLIHVPDEESVAIWDGQAGGIEGLNQDTWVITYLGQIKTALDPLKLKYHALCKGDDLRIAICIPQHTMSKENIPGFKNDIMERVSNTASQLGHKIKIEESFGSLKYFAFSKEASVGDIMLPQTLVRKIQKVHGYNNAFLPYLDDMAGSTYSNAHAACKVSANVLPCEITGLFWLYYYLTQHPSYQLLSQHEICGLSLVPSMCGGLPMIFHHNMYVRAESDLLAPFIGLLQYILVVDPDVGAVMSNFCMIPPDVPSSLERVYKDPYAIGTNMPALPSTVLRNKMESLLPRITKNQDVLNLITAAKSTSSQDFIRALDSSNILPARVFAALYASSPKGVLGEFMAKFETARSVLQVLILGAGRRFAQRLLKRLVKQEIVLQTWRVSVIKGKVRGLSYMSLIMSNTCPAKAANEIRELSWGKPVETVTMPPLQHQVYMTTPEEGATRSHDIRAHFTIKCYQSTSTLEDDTRPHYSTSPCRPFEGYTTRTGTVETTMSFVEKDVLLSKLQNIIELASWTNKSGPSQSGEEMLNSNLHLLISKVVEQYTDFPLKKFSPFVGSKRSGTVQHHIRCPGYRESIVPNTLLNVYTHMEGESDSNTYINSQPGQHYKINFLHIYCYAVVSASLHNEIFTTPMMTRTLWCVTRNCIECMTPIQETPIVIDESIIQDIDFSALRITKLTEDAMEVLNKSLALYEDRIYLVPNEHTDLDNKKACEGIRQELLETLVDSRNALITRYTQHAMSNEGRQVLGSFAVKNKRREIGLSELKGMSSKDLTECLVSVIYNYLMNHLRWDGVQKLDQHMVLIPTTELPWFELVSYLFRFGRMSDVFRYMMSKTQQTYAHAYNTPENCSLAIGTQVIVHADYFLRTKSIIILTNLATPQIKNHVSRQLYVQATVYFNTSVRASLPSKWSRDRTLDQSNMLLLYCYYWTLPFHRAEMMNVESENIGNRLIPVLDLLTSGVEEVIEAFDTNDWEVLKEYISGKGISILQQYGCRINQIFEYHNSSSEHVIESLNVLLSSFDISLTLTTLSDCVGKVREVTGEEQEGSEPEIIASPKKEIDLLPVSPSRSVRVVQLASAGRQTWTSSCHPPVVGVFPPINEPLRHVESLSRPYGILNSSMSTMMYILKEIGLLKGRPVEPLLVSCLADGLGNIASTLAKLAPRSLIFYSTLHDKLGLKYKPTELMNTCRENKCQLIYKSIMLGMTDLTHTHVVDYMIRTMPLNHIVTCDIEFKAWSINVFTAYKNVIRMYVLTRAFPAILIIKINHMFVDETIWVLHCLCSLCDFVYLIHPPTIRYHNISYAVCWMPSTDTDISILNHQCPMTAINVNIVSTYMKFREARLSSHIAKISEGLDIAPKMTPVTPCPLRMMIDVPSLFLSLVMSSVHLFIDPSWIHELTESQDDISRYMSHMADYLLTTSPLPGYLRVLYNHLEGDRTISIRTRSYDLNIRAHRVYIVQQIMILSGIIDYTTQVSQFNNLVVTYRTLKTMYLDRYDNLLNRDKYLTEPRSHFSICIMDAGINVSYYRNYIRGVDIGMTYFAHCRTIVATSRVKNILADFYKPQM